jgi:hypothetical protein
LLPDAVGKSTRFAGAAYVTRWQGNIDHSPGAHDDAANVVAGVAHCAVNRHTVKVTEALAALGDFLDRTPLH